MKKVFSYLRYSNIQIALNLNPFTWGFYYDNIEADGWNPGMRAWHLKVLMFRFSLVIDDGSF